MLFFFRYFFIKERLESCIWQGQTPFSSHLVTPTFEKFQNKKKLKPYSSRKINIFDGQTAITQTVNAKYENKNLAGHPQLAKLFFYMSRILLSIL